MKVYVVTNNYRKNDSVRLFWDLRAARGFIDRSEGALDEEFANDSFYDPSVWEEQLTRPPKPEWQEKEGYDLLTPPVAFPWWRRGDWVIRTRIVQGGPLTALAHCAEESA